MRRVDGASRNIDRPAGVAFSLQISGNSVEPTVASRSCNLFTHDDRGPDGSDEAKEVGPQMPWIVLPKSFSCDRERLARAGAGPERRVVRPSGHTRGDGPKPSSSKEVSLSKSRNVFWINVSDGPFIDDTVSDNSILDETFEDMRSRRF